jgi:protein disulfide-isomerase A1
LIKFIASQKVCVVFFGQRESREQQTFLSVAREIDGNFFAETSSNEAFSEYNVKVPGVVVFKKFDEQRNDFKGVFRKKDVKQFIEKKIVPSIMPLDQTALDLLFRKQ